MVPSSTNSSHEGGGRLASTVRSRGVWCISRQRSWGVPLPVFYKSSVGDGADEGAVLDDESFAHVRSLVAKHGSDCWFQKCTRHLLQLHVQLCVSQECCKGVFPSPPPPSPPPLLPPPFSISFFSNGSPSSQSCPYHMKLFSSLSIVSKPCLPCRWQLGTKDLLPPSRQQESDGYQRGTDTLDVWFDSGSSWRSVLLPRENQVRGKMLMW